MDKRTYHARRNKLVEEFMFLKSKHLPRTAAARVREIAKLDYDFDGTDPKKTKALFNYSELIK